MPKTASGDPQPLPGMRGNGGRKVGRERLRVAPDPAVRSSELLLLMRSTGTEPFLKTAQK
ncbi:hypothetical protein GCM10027162_65100 [Streptomyces incanus]